MDERGMAVPVALIVVVILLGLALAAVTVGLTGLSQSNRDRQAKRALTAADGGVDVATFRMNKAIVSGKLDGLLGINGLTTNALNTVGCVNASLAGVSLIDTSQASWCEQQTGNTEDMGDSASYTYWVKMNVNLAFSAVPADVQNLLTGSPTTVITRRVVSTGTSGGVQRRVLAVLGLGINVSQNPVALWKQIRWVECPASPSGGAPDSGCPSTGLSGGA